jgi:hypothetical protein
MSARKDETAVWYYQTFEIQKCETPIFILETRQSIRFTTNCKRFFSFSGSVSLEVPASNSAGGGESPSGRVSGPGQLDQPRVGSGTWPCFTVEKEAQQEPARRNATSESEHSVRLGSLKGSSARAPAEAGPRSVVKGQGLTTVTSESFPFWRRLRKKTGPRDSHACRSELLLRVLTTSLMGVVAAALSMDSAGPGLCRARAWGVVRRSETFTIPIASCLQGTILAPTPARPPRPASWLTAIRHFG